MMNPFNIFERSPWPYVVLLLLGLIFVSCAKYEHEKKALARAETTVATQHVTIKSQEHTIAVDQAVKKVDEATQVTVDKTDKVVVKQHEAIRQRIEEKEHVIRTRREAAPATLDNFIAEQQELSEARIDGLWEAYCAAAPAATACQPTQG